MDFQSSASGDFLRAFDVASQVLIRAKVNQGREHITLCELYETLGANTKAEQCSVRWGVRRMKDWGMIKKTSRRGVYEVIS
tara:strand:+ start:69 stop:311 length:243 start_codon:yes stop_codon:yes gene_type:complete